MTTTAEWAAIKEAKARGVLIVSRAGDTARLDQLARAAHETMQGGMSCDH